MLFRSETAAVLQRINAANQGHTIFPTTLTAQGAMAVILALLKSSPLCLTSACACSTGLSSRKLRVSIPPYRRCASARTGRTTALFLPPPTPQTPPSSASKPPRESKLGKHFHDQERLNHEINSHQNIISIVSIFRRQPPCEPRPKL